MTKFRHHFPQFSETAFEGAYLDSAATTLMPKVVLETMAEVARDGAVSGCLRGRTRAQGVLEMARRAIKSYFGCGPPSELVFTQSATAALNLLSHMMQPFICNTDLVVVSEAEHHSNLLPWHRLCKATGATLAVAPVDGSGELDLEALSSLARTKPKIFAVAHTSNVLGRPRSFGDALGLFGAETLKVVDATQAAGHTPLDFDSMDADSMVVSAHKMYGPVGIGALILKTEVFGKLSPTFVGGGAIGPFDYVDAEPVLGARGFEPGTQSLMLAAAWERSCQFLKEVGFGAIRSVEGGLIERFDRFIDDSGWTSRIAPSKGGAAGRSLCTFVVHGVHPHDVRRRLHERGICIRADDLCCRALLRKHGMVAACRASVGMYNDDDDITKLCEALTSIR